MAGSSEPYTLSTTLLGHQADVRTICEVGDDAIATGSLDEVAKLWRSVKGSATDFDCSNTFQGHNRYIYSVAYIPPTKEYADGLIATGSVDTNVHLYLPGVGEGPVRQLIGHSMAVCCVRAGPNETVLTSSWDGTAKIWTLDGTCKLTLEGHQKSVLSIIAHPTPGMYITCSADRTIRIWNQDACMGTMTGHTDVPRDLAVLQNGTLVSCANDGTVKFWNLDRPGPCTRTVQAHTGSYIYSICALPEGSLADFATSGEDGSVTVWKDYSAVQTIQLPCASAWSVAARSNGDLLVASADGCGRIFSADPSRFAEPERISSFKEHVAQVAMAQTQEDDGKIGDLDTSNLVGPERLVMPGEKDGQIIMVKDGGKVMAHAWSNAENVWNCLGEVADAKKKEEKAPPGWQYFDVELDDRKMVCRHKDGDNPFVTAQRFLDENELSQALLDQVVDFVEKNATAPTLEFSQPRTTPSVPGAYVPGGAGAAGSSSKMASAHFPLRESICMASVKFDGLFAKLREYNTTASPEVQLDTEAIGRITSALSAVGGNPNASFSQEDFFQVAPICTKLFNWPDGDARIPGMDTIRVLMSNKAFRRMAFSQTEGPLSYLQFKKIMLDAAGLTTAEPPASSACQMLALRSLANTYGEPVGLQDDVIELLSLFENFDVAGLNKHSQIAYATILLNSAISIAAQGEERVTEIGGELLRVVGRVLVKIQNSRKPEPEAQYRLLVAIGTLASSSDVMVAVALSLDDISSAVASASSASVTKVTQVAADMQNVLA